MKTQNVLDYKFEYNLKVAKENWKSDSSKTLHSCDEEKQHPFWLNDCHD